MPINHLGIIVSPEQFQKTIAFYIEALAPIGYTKTIEMRDGQAVGFGPKNSRPDFWVANNAVYADAPKRVGFSHFALEATTRAQVDEFYNKALQAGGKDNGAPGVRSHYHSDYYGAFVLDPEGNNVEIVNHGE